MATQDAENFDFSDDYFDELPEDDLVELENTAIRLTQKPPSSVAQDTRHLNHNRQQYQAGDDYGFDDEDVIDLDQQTIAFQKPFGRSHAAHAAPLQIPLRREATVTEHNPQDEANAPGISTEAPDTAGNEVMELRRKVLELERERKNLQTTLQSQKGEIAIVRNKYDQSTREFERKMSVLQQLQIEAAAKQKAELEKVRKEREMVETNNRFLEHDLAQELGRSKAARKVVKDGGQNKAKNSIGSPAMTPRKERQYTIGDGFDDGDMIMVSPSKGRERSKNMTPRVGAKRKRANVEQSPSLPLHLSESRRTSRPEDLAENSKFNIDNELLAKLRQEDHRFEILQRLMTLRPSFGTDLFFDALSRIHLSSQPSRSLSSIFVENLSNMPPYQDQKSFMDSFFRIILNLWERCLHERVFEPINHLIHSMKHMLAFERHDCLARLAPQVVPLALATIDIIAIPLGRASAPDIFPQTSSGSLESQTQTKLDIWSCLVLLHDTSLCCALTSAESIQGFWQLMQHDFILLMLMKAQPIAQISLALRIVATSALQNSFGASSPSDTADQKHRRESLLLDRLTHLLFDIPHMQHSSGPSADFELINLRIQTLLCLSAIAVTLNGGESLAKHRHAIGRIIRFLSDAVDALYDYHLPSRTELVRAINLCVRLLYHIIKHHSRPVDMRVKLDAVSGGTHKHLVSLTRIAFSDTLVLENGIEDEVTDMAHQLLDDFLSPEEGEALIQVFSSGKSAT